MVWVSQKLVSHPSAPYLFLSNAGHNFSPTCVLVTCPYTSFSNHSALTSYPQTNSTAEPHLLEHYMQRSRAQLICGWNFARGLWANSTQGSTTETLPIECWTKPKNPRSRSSRNFLREVECLTSRFPQRPNRYVFIILFEQRISLMEYQIIRVLGLMRFQHLWLQQGFPSCISPHTWVTSFL